MIVVAMIVLLIVASITFAVTRGGTETAQTVDPESGAADRSVAADPEALSEAGFRELPAPPAEVTVGPGSTPQDAVRGFLTAEANDDYEASFTFLAADEQAQYGSAAGWVAAHADVLPPVTAFELQDAADTSDPAQIPTTVGFRPSLDEVVGLIPAQAAVTWAVVETDGAFEVSLEGSTFEPILLDDDGVTDAVESWVASRQACRPAGEWGGPLLGAQGPVTALCDAQGSVEVGASGQLPALEAAPFVTAFGEEAASWARVVEVTSPSAFRVVLAPVGPRWLVIGALPADAIGGG